MPMPSEELDSQKRRQALETKQTKITVVMMLGTGTGAVMILD